MGIGTGLVQRLFCCFGIGRPDIERDAHASAPQATSLAQRSIASAPDTRRSRPGTGLLAKIRSWKEAVFSGSPRSKPDPAIPLHDALRTALDSPAKLGELAGRRIEGRYLIDTLRPPKNRPARAEEGLRAGPNTLERDRNALLALRDQGAQLGNVALMGRIRLPAPWNGEQAVALVKELAGTRSGTDDPQGPNSRGLTVETGEEGVDVGNPVDLELLEQAVGCNVKLGRIKLTGEVRDLEGMKRVASLLKSIASGKGKTDLSALRLNVDIVLAAPPREQARSELQDLAGGADLAGAPVSQSEADRQLSQVLSDLLLLKAHGAYNADLTVRGDFDLDVQPIAQLRSLLGLVEECRIVCASPERLFEGLTLRATVPSGLMMPGGLPASPSLEPYDVSALARLLERAYKVGAKLVLTGNVTFGTGQRGALGALYKIARIPGVDASRVSVKLEHEKANFTLTPADVQKLEYLHGRGVAIAQEIQTRARVGMKSKAFTTA